MAEQVTICECGHWSHELPAKGPCVNMGCDCKKYKAKKDDPSENKA